MATSGDLNLAIDSDRAYLSRTRSPGSSYTTLMDSTRADRNGNAALSLTRYYAESEDASGPFRGAMPGWSRRPERAGLRSMVMERHLWPQVGMLQEPVTGKQRGRPPISRLELH